MATINNSVQYTLSLRDMLSNTLNRAQNNVQGFDKEIDRTVADIQRLNSALLQTGNLGGSFMQTTGAVAIGSMLTRGIEMAGRAAVDQVKSILSAGLDASKLRAEFSTLTGGADMGQALFGDLTKYIQDSIFGTELYQSAKTLLSYGDSARQILPDLKMLGDIAMGDKEKMQSLVVAFGQVMSTGKLMGQDLNQMIQGAGFNPLMVIAEKTKGEKTIEQRYAELKKMGEQGEISFGMIRQAFEDATSEGGRFYKMLDNIGETPFGKYQAMLGNIDAAKQQLGEALLPAVNDFMNASKPLIDALPAMFEALKPTIDNTIESVTNLVKWVSEHGKTVENAAKAVKLIAEGYAIWKAGTIALSAVNWVLARSIGADAVATTEAAAATTAHNAAMTAEAELVAALAVEYDALTVSITGMSAAQKAAMASQAAQAFSIPMSMAGTAAAANAGAAGAAGAVMGGISKAVLPVAIMYFAGEALAQFLPKGTFGTDKQGNEIAWWEVFDRIESKFDRMEAYRTGNDVKYKTSGSSLTNDILGLNGAGGLFGYGKTSTNKNNYAASGATTPADTLKSDIGKITGQQVKNTYITINGGLIHDFTIKTTTLGESKAQIKRIVTETLTDSINDSQITD